MKKVAILILALVSMSVSGQVSIGIDKVDDFTGKRTISTNPERAFNYNNSNFYHCSVAISHVDSMDYLYLILNVDLGCLSQNRSTAQFLLENGEIVEFTQVGKTDCSDSPYASFAAIDQSNVDGKLSILYPTILENWATLLSSPIVKLRVTGTDNYVDFVPIPEGRKTRDMSDVILEHYNAISEIL